MENNSKIEFDNKELNYSENKMLIAEKPKMKIWKKILIGVIISIFVLGGLLLYLPSILGIFFRDIPKVNDADLKLEPIVVSDSDNAYFDYAKIDSIVINKAGDQDTATFLASKNWDQSFVDEILNKNQEAIQIFEQSVRKSKYQDPIMTDLNSFGPNTILSPVSHIRTMAQVISIKSANLSKEGKQKEALEKAFEIIDMGQKLKHSQTLIHYLVGIAINKVGLERIQYLIKDSNLSADILNTYQGRLETFKNNNENIKNIFKSEYILGVNALNMLSTEEITSSVALSNTDSVDKYMRNSSRGFFYFHPNQTKELFANRARKQMALVDKTCDQIAGVNSENKLAKRSLIKIYFTPNAIGKILNDVVDVSLNSFILKECEQKTLIVNIQLDLAKRAYFNANGKQPESINDLIPNYLPQELIDPYNGKEIKF